MVGLKIFFAKFINRAENWQFAYINVQKIRYFWKKTFRERNILERHNENATLPSLFLRIPLILHSKQNRVQLLRC